MGNKRSGSALIMLTTVISLLMITAFLVAANSVSDTDVTNKEKIRTMLELACESGLKRAKTKIEESFNNSDLNKLEPDITFQGNDIDDTGKTAAEKAFSDEEYIIGTPGYYKYTYNTSNNKNVYVQYAITEDNGGEGWDRSSIHTTYKMKIESIAYAPGYGWIGMTENAYSQRTTLFMYQIFFENDLEILPGPNFNLNGMIHTNQSMYLGSNNNLNIYTDSLTAAEDIIRGRLDRTEIIGEVNISKGDADGDMVELVGGKDSKNSDWVNIATKNWEGTVKDKKMGASRLEAPKLQSFQPGGYYDKNAGIKIEVVTSYNPPRYKITYNNTTSIYTSAQLNNALTETKIYDYREYPSGSKPSNNKYVKVTNVDVNKLKTALGYYPDNGLIYMTRQDAVPDKDGNDYTTDPNRIVTAFKLVNSLTLPGPTTFVSNLPVYIHGDYNKHTSSDPQIDTWQPSAIISDSITLLSNNWSDSKSNWKDPKVVYSTAMPVASAGEYNLVFVTGNLPTKKGQYNGGLENFPRFLENWSGKNAKISGGFIQLFRSKYATGQWGDSYYSPPNRIWGAESRFADLSNLPPGYVDLFPSVNIGIAYSNWRQISKDEASIEESQ